MKPVKVRRAILFCFFLFLPIIQFYFSPYVPIRAALSGGIAISLIVFLVLFLVGIFFGRAPCGWIMPCGGLQESCFYINDRRIVAGKKDRIKFLIWSLWVGLLISILWLNADKLHLNLMYAIDNGISVSKPLYYIPYYTVIFIVLLLCLIFGKRALCHYGCWMAPFMIFGRKLGNLLRVPGLRLKANQHKCIGCGTCTNVCPMGIEVEKLVKKGNLEHSECILCPECSKACKTNSIQLTFSRYEKEKNNHSNVSPELNRPT